jgi:DNA polymerase III gamma/tau subunit
MAEQQRDYEFHREYRPRSFEEYVGNQALKTAVLSVVGTAHTYLFCGPRGCGKTTLARLISHAVGAADMDVHEINAADKTGVDDAREIIAKAPFAPMGGKSKVYIIDECHRLSGSAEDSFLKILEEPPKHCYFILCTTEPEKVKATIKSRAKVYEVKPLTVAESGLLIDWVCSEENIKLPKAVRQAIIEKDDCAGIPREMLVALDMVCNITSETEAIATIAASQGSAGVIDLCRALIQKAKWPAVGKILREIADEPENVRYAVLGYMNSVLTKGDNKQAVMVIMNFTESFMYSKKAGLTLACYQSVMD